MLKVTSDQLSYILERKFPGICPGRDYIITQSVDSNARDPLTGLPQSNLDAHITEWRLDEIEQPSVDELKRLWIILEEQYHSEIDRPDSKMHKFMVKRNTPKVVINEKL